MQKAGQARFGGVRSGASRESAQTGDVVGNGLDFAVVHLGGHTAHLGAVLANTVAESGQLGGGVVGVRKNSAQMSGVAAKMNDREIKAVADYIAGLR